MDRNDLCLGVACHSKGSLSARRAWIEIIFCRALLAVVASLSARRAWIEISAWGPHGTGAESLSARRAWIEIGVLDFGPGEVFGRSPQGERG